MPARDSRHLGLSHAAAMSVKSRPASLDLGRDSRPGLPVLCGTCPASAAARSPGSGWPSELSTPRPALHCGQRPRGPAGFMYRRRWVRLPGPLSRTARCCLDPRVGPAKADRDRAGRDVAAVATAERGKSCPVCQKWRAWLSGRRTPDNPADKSASKPTAAVGESPKHFVQRDPVGQIAAPRLIDLAPGQLETNGESREGETNETDAGEKAAYRQFGL